MKSILMITGSLMIAFIYGQIQTPEQSGPKQSANQSQSSGNSQDKSITNLSNILADGLNLDMTNRVGDPLNRPGQALKDKDGLCVVHHTTLKEATIPVHYGLRRGQPYYKETEKKLFPNAITDINGGCIVMPVKEAIVLQCQQCLEAKANWVKSQK